MTDFKSLLDTRITTKWWLDKDVSNDDLNYILECARLAPSLHGKFTTSIFVSRDATYKKWLYENNTYCYGIPGKGPFKRAEPHPENYNPEHKRYNGQVNAPVILTWLYTGNRNPSAKGDYFHDDAEKDAYISASYASVAALERKIDFGFCTCIGGKEISKFLQIGTHAIIIMGLGYKDDYQGSYQRQVYNKGNHVGWDRDNIPPKIRDSSGRKYRPNIGDYVIWDQT